MATLAQQVQKRIDDQTAQLKASEKSALEGACGEYRELLKRADKPEPGDVDRLPEVLRIIGRDLDEFQRDSEQALIHLPRIRLAIKSMPRLKRDCAERAKAARSARGKADGWPPSPEKRQVKKDADLAHGLLTKSGAALRKARLDVERLDCMRRNPDNWPLFEPEELIPRKD